MFCVKHNKQEVSMNYNYTADGYGPSYTYTTDRKLATRTWARKDAQDNDLVTAYSYNLFGELIGIDYSDSTPDITYSYNRIGKLSQVTDAVGTRTFAYNAELDEVSETITGLYSKTLTRTYTGTGFKGKKQGLSINNVSHYSYGYDTYGRMDRITTPSGSFGYTRLTNSDLVAQMTRPNGVTTTWSYETDRDLIMQIQNGTISAYGYVNDAVGRRTSMSRSGSAYANPDTIAYTYNDRSELTGAVSNVDTTYSYSYVYDPIGNRVTASEAGVPWTYTTNSLNQYTSATEYNVQMNFSYDLDGSMTYRPVDATSGWTQAWNGENRMVETSKGTDRLTFKYDYMGRRVEKCVYSGNTLTSKTLFVYDGFKCVEELDALNDNAILMRHTWQPFEVGLDVILATADTSGMSYFLHDANKNVMQKTVANGTQQEIYAYAPFGENIGLDRGHVGISSEMEDNAAGMGYYNYRYLVSKFGRWISKDPMFDDANLYVFIENSPISQFDNLGLFGDGKTFIEHYLRTHKLCLHYSQRDGRCLAERPYTKDEIKRIVDRTHLGHSDFFNNSECPFDYTLEDNRFWTSPINLITGIGGHFRPLLPNKKDTGTLNDVIIAIKSCNFMDFQKYMHQAQDYYSHYDKGYRAWEFTDRYHLPPGHLWAWTGPDNDSNAWFRSNILTLIMLFIWNNNCCLECPKEKCVWTQKSNGGCAK